jgi:hypothetical protein
MNVTEQKEAVMKSATVFRTCVFACVVAILLLGSVPPAQPAQLPGVSIAPAPNGLEPEVAALSGIWEGNWDAMLPSRLTVEMIDAEWASIVYAWAEDPSGQFNAGWARAWAKVGSSGSLGWRYPGDFTFELSEDHAALVGKKFEEGRTVEVIMHRVEPFRLSASPNTSDVAELPR